MKTRVVPFVVRMRVGEAFDEELPAVIASAMRQLRPHYETAWGRIWPMRLAADFARADFRHLPGVQELTIYVRSRFRTDYADKIEFELRMKANAAAPAP